MKHQQTIIYIALVISILASAILFSCSSSKKDVVNIDSTAAIAFGVNHVFKTISLSQQFKSEPIKIIRSKNVPKNINFQANGMNIEVVDPQSRKVLKGDNLNPLPYLEVIEIHSVNDTLIKLSMQFPSLGLGFHIEMENKQNSQMKILSLEDYHYKW
jgi:hypothetical protein